jgi:hypothetical protein
MEFPAFPAGIASDRPADAVELGGEHGVAQCLLTDVEVAGGVALGDLRDRLRG